MDQILYLALLHLLAAVGVVKTLRLETLVVLVAALVLTQLVVPEQQIKGSLVELGPEAPVHQEVVVEVLVR
jgi:hypothetical protein